MSWKQAGMIAEHHDGRWTKTDLSLEHVDIPKFTETTTISRTTRLENTLSAANKIFYSQHTTAPCFFKCILSPHSCVCTQHLVARSNKSLLLPCYLLVFSPTVDSILSNSHSLRCLAAPVRAATAIRRKGWRQRHAPQPFNCAIQRACTRQYAHVHLQHVLGAIATLTPFTGYEPKNPHQWLVII